MEQQEKLEQIVPERSARFSLDPWKFCRNFRPFLEEKNWSPRPSSPTKGGVVVPKKWLESKGVDGGDEGREGDNGVQRRRKRRRRRRRRKRKRCYHSGTNEQTRKDRATQPIDHGRLRWAIGNISFSRGDDLPFLFCLFVFKFGNNVLL